MNTLFDKRNLPLVILNVVTILVVAIMLVVSQATAKSDQTSQALNSGMLSYQGTLMDTSGNPVIGSYDMTFRIYNSLTSTTPIWEEVRTGGNTVPVQKGLFNVMLGSLNPIPSTVWEEAVLYLGIKIGSDAELSPREKLAVMPSAVMANVAQLALTVPDGSITGAHIADGTITQVDAPTLIQSGSQNDFVRSGSTVIPSGSASNGAITISYPCFPNDVRVFLAINGDHSANGSYVYATQGTGRCETTIYVSPPTPYGIRIDWIAIGN